MLSSMTDPKIYTALLHLQHPWYISRVLPGRISLNI